MAHRTAQRLFCRVSGARVTPSCRGSMLITFQPSSRYGMKLVSAPSFDPTVMLPPCIQNTVGSGPGGLTLEYTSSFPSQEPFFTYVTFEAIRYAGKFREY